MLLLDANIPIYAHGREHFYREPCRTIMGRVKTHPHNYAVDTETFQEILYIYSRRGQTALGVAVTQELLNLQPAIISITIAEIRAAIRLLQYAPGIAPRAESDANIYILPGHQFRAVDAMLTNFHLPRSTLLMLVSAFAAPPDAGRKLMLATYAEAIRLRYRFYSFGDAMLMV